MVMTNRDRARYPSFIGIGPPRTATDWIHRVLEDHVRLPRHVKETDFFSTNYSKGTRWYLSHFARYPADLVAGEINPNYFDHSEASTRIMQNLPVCKVICSLRNPVERTHSHYRMFQTIGYVGRQSFEQAIQSHLGWQFGPGNMIGSSYYAFHLRRWLGMFGREQVLITFYEDLRADPQRFIDSVTQFIGAPGIDLKKSAVGTMQLNRRARSARNPELAARSLRLQKSLVRRRMYRTRAILGPLLRCCFGRGDPFPEISPQTARMLRDYFRPDIEALEELVQRDLSSWKN
jgi:Sulfotransferase domain